MGTTPAFSKSRNTCLPPKAVCDMELFLKRLNDLAFFCISAPVTRHAPCCVTHTHSSIVRAIHETTAVESAFEKNSAENTRGPDACSGATKRLVCATSSFFTAERARSE